MYVRSGSASCDGHSVETEPLPSMSCITMHDSLSSSASSPHAYRAERTSRAHSASSAARRSSPASPVPTRTSRCSRFLTTLPSGTRWKNSRGPTPEGSTQANAEPRCSGGRARRSRPRWQTPPVAAVRRTPHLAPEPGDALRFRAVKGDLDLLDRRHRSTIEARCPPAAPGKVGEPGFPGPQADRRSCPISGYTWDTSRADHDEVPRTPT